MVVMRSIRIGKAVFFCILISALLTGFIRLAYTQEFDNDPHATGLILPSPEQEEAFRKTHPKIEKVLLNRIALERVNAGRAKRGMLPLSEDGLAPFGKEVIHPRTPVPQNAAFITGELLGYVPYKDNSLEMDAFPLIRSQGQIGSCGSFAITYYMLTHMAGTMYGWNNKNENNETKFSPKWTYNFVNFLFGGENQGSYAADNFDVLERHGAATWAQFEYDGVDYKTWCTDTEVWRNAIGYRINPAEYIDVDAANPESALEQIKALILAGRVVTFPTYISSWQFTTIKDNKQINEDDPFVGETACFWVNGTSGPHLMTIVGYHDLVWIDINRNRKVDAGEEGALKIANSWGTGWKDGGFTWLAYDALRAESAVPRGPDSGRVPAIRNMVYSLTLKDVNYSPQMVAKFTIDHIKRNQLRVNLGISDDTSALTPSITWYSGTIDLQGGSYDFNGLTNGCPATFVFDFTDILPEDTATHRYFLGVYDGVADDPATLSSFGIEDIKHSSGYISGTISQYVIDNEEAYAYVNYEFDTIGNPPNQVPIPVIKIITESGTLVDPQEFEGQIPLTLRFDGADSYDPDNLNGINKGIATYFWNFGDGPWSRLAIDDHTYETPGLYSAKLTVTDNSGATSSKSVAVTVNPDLNNTMHVSDIAMSITVVKKTGMKYAKATVTIVDGSGSLISGVKVCGGWSGLTEDNDCGNTNNRGQVVFSSDSVDASATGAFTFCVGSVTLKGWYYDTGANVEECDSIQ